MNVDLHITTCHHSTVTCRPRMREYPRSNVRQWTKEERLEISKIAVNSIIRFCRPLQSRHNIRISLLDDGSDMPEAIAWLDSLKEIEVIRNNHAGSAAAINNYLKTIKPNTDLIVHFEDDMIPFNPEQIDWVDLSLRYLESNQAKDNKVIGVHFKGGLPTDLENPQRVGNWGPVGFIKGNDSIPSAWKLKLIANFHHILKPQDYRLFLPLSANRGECEAMMGYRLQSLKRFMAEIQVPIYVFHTHMLNCSLPEIVTSEELSLSGMGIEYGILDIENHLKAGKPITCSVYEIETKKTIKTYQGYYY